MTFARLSFHAGLYPTLEGPGLLACTLSRRVLKLRRVAVSRLIVSPSSALGDDATVRLVVLPQGGEQVTLVEKSPVSLFRSIEKKPPVVLPAVALRAGDDVELYFDPPPSRAVFATMLLEELRE